MASTTALLTGLSGLRAHARSLDVIGHNIANANTTAFKSSRALFASVMGRTVRAGSAPDGVHGGTNPYQVGMGVKVGSVQRDFRDGAISVTGNPRDLAIEGDGFFVVRHEEDTFFTRAGAFRMDADNMLVTGGGAHVQGYAVDSNFVVQPGSLTDITVPIGELTIAEATQTVRLGGNLDADGLVASSGTSISLLGAGGAGLALVAGASNPPAPPNALETGSLLTEIEDPLLPGSGTALMTAGQRIVIDGAEKGSRLLPLASFVVGAASTVGDLMGFLSNALGIDTALGPNPDGNVPGVALNPATGVITVTGNTGEANDITIPDAAISLVSAAGTPVRLPFDVQAQAPATGESVTTTFVVYDSLGAPVTLDLTMVLEDRADIGTTWRYSARTPDGTQVGSGTVMFDTAGQYASAPVTLSVPRTGTGAQSPLTFTLAFRNPDGGGVTGLASDDSQLAAIFQDGAPPGTLIDFGVEEDGTIVGTFSNAATRPLGQVALAQFTNPGGLVDNGAGLWAAGANSGEPVITEPTSGGAGRLVEGALELSNVDLGREFIELILTSTGYSASSRVVRTADELLQQLLVLGR